MDVSVEISFYPLVSAYGPPVSEFISRLKARPDIEVVPGGMSTVVIGGYDEVFGALNEEIKVSMEKHPSVFTLKIANSCPV